MRASREGFQEFYILTRAVAIQAARLRGAGPMSGLLEAAREVKERGAFAYHDRSFTPAELNGLMRI
jgi:hypothetical protein